MVDVSKEPNITLLTQRHPKDKKSNFCGKCSKLWKLCNDRVRARTTAQNFPKLTVLVSHAVTLRSIFPEGGERLGLFRLSPYVVPVGLAATETIAATFGKCWPTEFSWTCWSWIYHSERWFAIRSLDVFDTVRQL